jgi:hypothetical protein
MITHPTYATALIFDFSPALPLCFCWLLVVRRKGLGTLKWQTLAPLSWGSVSVLWLAAGLLFPQVLGPDYSTIRYLIIDGNFVLMALGAILALGQNSFIRAPLGIACVMAAIVWSFVAAINASV